jgi:glycosyltransferase involved in cell wall biosynthesis
MKICFIAEFYKPSMGGQYTILKEIAAQCKKKKIKYTIVHKKKNNYLNKILLNKIFNSFDIFYFFGGWNIFYIKLHLLALKLKKKIIIHPLGFYEPWALSQAKIKKKIAWILFQKKLLLTADLIHCASIKEKKNISKLDKKFKTTYLPLGINDNFIKKKIKFTLKKKILFFSRLVSTKGVNSLINAWIDIGKKDWTLDIVGVGNNKKFIREVNKSNKNIKINFLKPIYTSSKKKTLFDKYDCLVLPTKNESFGLVILESMARALPVLTTNETPWISIQKRNAGWIINDSFVELKLVLHKIFQMKEKDFIIKMKNSIKLASNFKWSKIFPLYLKAFKKII